MKLKPLKDIKQHFVECNDCGEETGNAMIETKQIKQEAIKWVKERHTGDWFLLFRLFFNITEEDLA